MSQPADLFSRQSAKQIGRKGDPYFPVVMRWLCASIEKQLYTQPAELQWDCTEPKLVKKMLFAYTFKSLRTSLYEAASPPPWNSLDRRGGWGWKAGKADRCQRFRGRGQRSRAGDLGIQQTRLPFPPPPAQWKPLTFTMLFPFLLQWHLHLWVTVFKLPLKL